jgi:hypothetical protein
MKPSPLLLAAALLGAPSIVRAQAPATPPEPVILENDLLKVSVSPVGARIVSLLDKVRQRENVKVLPYYGGMNIVRFGAALNLDEKKDVYAMKLEKLPDGSQKLVATAKAVPTDDKPGAATVTKEFVLPPGSSCLRLAVELRNEGKEELGLIPWIQHLLLRGTKEQPEETWMNDGGAYLQVSGRPARMDAHHFPAGNWTARVTLPVEDPSNLIATVVRPEDVFKIYNWHRAMEDFATQEVIAQPLFAAPGNSCRLDYAVVVAPPVRSAVYVSPDLAIGVSPHPTGLAASTKELSLDFASTRDLAGLRARARLVAAGQPGKVLKEEELALPSLSPKGIAQVKLAVNLQDHAAYQLLLSFTRDGKPFVPGAALGDRPEVIVPLVVGKPEAAGALFPKPTASVGRLRQVQPQAHAAKLACTGDAFDAFGFPSSQRCFRGDTFRPSGKGPIQLHAGAGEYESAQVVLVPKLKAEAALDVAGSDLVGPSGAKVAFETANDFLYVPTTTPSSYNALFPLGEYPEALLPVKKIVLKPTGNHPVFLTWRVPADAKPGLYRGSVAFSQGAARHEVPVEMTVWNFRIPLCSRNMEMASSLKGNTLEEARHADGSPYTRKEQLDAIVDMHLKYRLTPCDSGMVNDLLKGDFAAFEPEMKKFIDGGATKIFLGQVPALLKSYGSKLPEVERYLEQKGWIPYFYVRPGFDEASSDLVPKIKEMCQEWKKVSKIAVMETYYHDERAQELFGSLDIWSRSPPLGAWCRERMAKGDRFWKVNAMPNPMETEPWVSARKRYVGLWDLRFTGTYLWTVKAWSGVKKWGEDYWCDGGVGNLSAVMMWPHATGILSTIRLEALRDGIEDNAMLWMLRDKVEAMQGKTPSDPAQAAALAKARTLCSGEPLADRIRSAEDLERLRVEAGNALSALKAAP